MCVQQRRVDSRRCVLQARPSTSFVDDTIDLPRQNFLSLEFGTKFQREVPLFLEVPEFPEAYTQNDSDVILFHICRAYAS